ILDDAQEFSLRTERVEVASELYWEFLLAAAVFLGIGMGFIRERFQLYGFISTALVLFVVLARWG
ncbi:uncharacterized protein METZ01_LOCUS367734, partial [marine metagenome]